MSDARHFILGTAGHIDHGKSSLVRALTGTNPDRLPEEQRRGVTIELGFAHLTLDDPDHGQRYELGIVDVPGHADFINNMVAGVGGMDLALFVVAADDGWMPQSEEHLHILSFLGIKRGIIALTKADLTDDLEFAEAFVRDSLQGSTLEEAPIIPVSSTTGTGIEELRACLAAELAQTPPPPNFGKPLLPVDRAFTVKGIGTVITGTLNGGNLRVGDRLTLQPEGLEAHVRSLQNHSQPIDEAEPGMRVALNLPELPLAQRGRPGVRRGMLLTSPQPGERSETVNVEVTRLNREIPGQNLTKKPLPSGRRVRVHHGSGSTGARLFLMEERELAPGNTQLAQLRFDDPHFLMVGDHLVLRDWSGEATVGGARVLETLASRKGIRNDDHLNFLRQRASNTEDVGALLDSALQRDHYLDLASIENHLRASADELKSAVQALLDQKGAYELGEKLAAASWWDEILTRACDLIGAYHKKNADLPGLPLSDLRQALAPRLPEERLMDRLLEHLEERGVTQLGTVLAESSFTPRLPDEIKAAAETIQQALSQEPLNPPGRGELADDTNSRRALSFLIRSGTALELNDKVLVLTTAYRQACEQILEFIGRAGRATASDIRQELGTTRRVVMPLLERMDSEGLTRRDGDYRTVNS